MRNPGSKKNFSVQDGDVIIIGKIKYSHYRGCSKFTGNYQYIKGLRLNDYVNMAGGYTSDARRFATYVSNLDGSSEKVNLLSFSPAVTDGARIIVPTKLEVEPFSMTEYVTNLTQIYSDLTQAYLMVLLAARN